MSGAFDPYHRWLGIPVEEQPSHYYRLLGLAPFEEDPEVIRDAAERQMAHVRGYGLGQHASLSQKVLNELAAAKACLSDPAKKAEYDRRLRHDLAATRPVPPPAAAQASKVAQAAAGPAAGRSGPAGPPPMAVAPARATRVGPPQLSRPRAPGRWVPLAISGAAAAFLLLVVFIAIVWLTGTEKPPAPARLELQQIASQTAEPGRELTLAVRVADPNAWEEKLQFSLAGEVPSRAAIDPRTGQFAWTPQAPGRYEISVKVASDGEGGQEDQATFLVCVPPRLPEIGLQTVTVGNTLELPIQVEDPGLLAGDLRYGLAPGAPQGATIEPKTGQFRWTPTEEQGPGKHSITVQVALPGSDELAARTTFPVEVVEAREAPVEVVKTQEANQKPLIQPITDQWVEAGAESEFAVKAIDPDGDQLAYTPVGVLDWVKIDPRVGTITCSPSSELAGKSYPVTVRVIDNGKPEPRYAEVTVNIVVAEPSEPPGGDPREPPTPSPGPMVPTPSPTAVVPAPSPTPRFPTPLPPPGFPTPSPPPGFPRAAPGYPSSTAGQRPSYPTPAPPPQDPTLKTITLDLEKKLTAYDLEADRALPEGDLYVELFGPESWPIPARFEDGKNRIPLKGKATIKWSHLEGPEISVKFLRFPDALRLQVESVCQQGARMRRPPGFTVEQVESWKNKLPQELAQDVAEYKTLQVVGPRLQVRLGELQTDLQQAMRGRNPSGAGKVQTALRNCQNDLNRALKRFHQLDEDIPKLQALVAALPQLDQLAKSLHRSAKLYYRISPEQGEK